ncbi:MAG: helix-turn-helix domain-containing protein [Fibrobacter sp.]|nr:helix-turn-helix domain-containing protein [Fibrobacter sp.]
MADSKENTHRQESLGNYLARAREAKHVSKKALAEEMHISIDVLERIEAGDWASFPVDAYVRAYLNSIATFLELDGDDVVARFDREKGIETAKPAKAGETASADPKPKSSSRKGLLILIVLLCVVVLAVLFRLNNPKSEAAPPASASKAEIPAQDSLTEDSFLSEESSLILNDSILEKVDSIASDLPKVSDSIPSSTTVFLSAGSGTEKTETEVSSAAAKTKSTYSSRLEFYGTDSTSSWIGIQKKPNDTLFVRETVLKKPGTFFEYGSNDTLYVTIGNRDGISKLMLNGKEIYLAKGSGKTAHMKVYSGKIISGVR